MMTKTNGRAREAAIYTRVSSTRQELEGTSLTTQEVACRAFAREHGFALGEGHIYREVHTGVELWERPQLTALRAAVRAREIDVVIAFAIDRLSRDPVHLGVILTEAEHARVGVEFVTEPLDESPEGQLIRFVRGYAAKIEHEKIKERSVRGRMARARAGKPIPTNRPLYGYRWADEAKAALDPDPSTAPVVRRVFTRCLEGTSLRQIADELHDLGVPTPNGAPRWARTTVHAILTHPYYFGEPAAWKGSIPLSTDAVPPLVSPDEGEAVKARLQVNRQRSTRNARDPETALLRGGFARCGVCGRTLIVANVNKGLSYACRTDKWRCSCPSMRVRLLDEAVWARVSSVLDRDEVIETELERLRSDDPTEADLATLDRSLVDANRKQARLVDALADLDPDSAEAVKAKLVALTAQKKQLQAEREAVLARRSAWAEAEASIAQVREWRARIAGRLRTFSWAERRLALEALGIRVQLYGEGHEPRWIITGAIALDGRVHGSIVYTATKPPGPGIATSRPSHG